jgi:hypothetical protein
MGLFEGLAKNMFKTTSDGRTAFYPWGRFASGYILRSSDEEQKARILAKRTHIIMMSLGIITGCIGDIISWKVAISMVIAALIIYEIYFRKFIKGMERAKDKLLYQEGMNNFAHNQSHLVLVVILMMGIVSLIASIYVLYLNTIELHIPLIATIFSVVGVVYLIRIIQIKRNHNKNQL